VPGILKWPRGQLNLQRLEHADDPRGRAVTATQQIDGGDEIGRREPVVDLDDVGEGPSIVAGRRLLHDTAQPDVG
jgi:hypothetical protein